MPKKLDPKELKSRIKIAKEGMKVQKAIVDVTLKNALKGEPVDMSQARNAVSAFTKHYADLVKASESLKAATTAE